MSVTLHLVSNFNRSNKARIAWNRSTGLDGLLRRASDLLHTTAARLYAADGELIADAEVIRDNETLYVSSGELFVRSPTVQPPAMVALESKGVDDDVKLAIALSVEDQSQQAQQSPQSQGWSPRGWSPRGSQWYQYRRTRCISVLMVIAFIIIAVGASHNSWSKCYGSARYGLFGRSYGNDDECRSLSCGGTGCSHMRAWQALAVIAVVSAGISTLLQLLSHRYNSCRVKCWQHLNACISVALGVAATTVWALDNKHRFSHCQYGSSFYLFVVGLGLELIAYRMSRRQQWYAYWAERRAAEQSGAAVAGADAGQCRWGRGWGRGWCSRSRGGCDSSSASAGASSGRRCWFSRFGSSSCPSASSSSSSAPSIAAVPEQHRPEPQQPQYEQPSQPSHHQVMQIQGDSSDHHPIIYSAPAGQYAYPLLQ